jgi:class 3 adenylate cyclase
MTKTYLLDLLERVATTFAGGALAVLVADGVDLTNLTVWEGAGVAGLAAVMSLVKGIIAGRTGKDSASLARGV